MYTVWEWADCGSRWKDMAKALGTFGTPEEASEAYNVFRCRSSGERYEPPAIVWIVGECPPFVR